MSALTEIKGIGPALAAAFAANGFKTVDKIALASPQEFAVVPGISVARAGILIAAAKTLASATATPETNQTAEKKKKKKKKENPKKKGSKKKGRKKKK